MDRAAGAFGPRSQRIVAQEAAARRAGGSQSLPSWPGWRWPAARARTLIDEDGNEYNSTQSPGSGSGASATAISPTTWDRFNGRARYLSPYAAATVPRSSSAIPDCGMRAAEFPPRGLSANQTAGEVGANHLPSPPQNPTTLRLAGGGTAEPAGPPRTASAAAGEHLDAREAVRRETEASSFEELWPVSRWEAPEGSAARPALEGLDVVRMAVADAPDPDPAMKSITRCRPRPMRSSRAAGHRQPGHEGKGLAPARRAAAPGPRCAATADQPPAARSW